jgi:hypothetical protein
MPQIELLTITTNDTGLSLGYIVLNLDRTVCAAFSTVGMVEVGNGVDSVAAGVAAPDAGGYIQGYKAPGGTEFGGETAVRSTAENVTRSVGVARSGRLAETSDVGTAGAVAWTYTLLSDVDSAPISQACVGVWNSDNTLLVTQPCTDNNGPVTVYLDPGEYSLCRSEVGWSFTNADTELAEEPSL